MKKNFKKIITVMLLSVLIINQLSMQMITFAAAPSDNNWGNQFITSVKFTDRDGNVISSVPNGQDFKVRYEFAIPLENEDDMQAGQYMLVELPKELQTIQNDSLPFKDKSGAVVANGQATVKGGSEYKVVFTDYVENHSNITGFFEFYVNFSDDVKPGEEIPIEFPIGDGSVVVPITPEDPDGPPGSGEGEAEPSKYYKSGYYLGNGEILWVVNVAGPKFKEDPNGPGIYEPFRNLKIFDNYGPGQELISDSVEVRQAIAWTGGFHVRDRLADAPIEKHDPVARTFEVALGDTIDGYGRQISYKTKVTNPDQEEFVNKAHATADDLDKEMEEKIRVEGGTAGAEGTTAGFTVVKQDSDGNSLEGASFNLYRITANGETEIATGLTSDKDGKVSYDKLRFGTYELRETSAPEGYKLLETPYRFVLTSAGMTTLEVPIVNEREEAPVGSVELIKYDEADESKGLAGAEFDLFRGTPGSGTLVSSHVTPASGAFQVDNLEFGNYYFVETKAPAGYELDATPRTFTIGEGQVTVPFELQVANKAIEAPVGSVELIKYDEADESKGLAGAEFDLFRGTPGSGTLVSNHVTPASGKFQVNNLEFGNYYFVETKAPAGYELDATPRTFTIGEGQVTVPFELKVSNQATVEPLGSVEFTKVDADTQNPLAGAEFTLYEGTSSAPGNQVGVYTSAAITGKVTVNDLPYGNYHFVETKAPNGGYILDGKPINFEIVSDTTVLELDNVTNKRDYKPQIETLAFETGTNNKELYPGMATQISDRVMYEQLTPGKNYRLEAKLMTKDGQTTLTQGSKTFTVTTENGEEVVALDGFDARA
ncbi:SpaA isopeptide-forming pilin-related protein, partial [Paenilisteria newyorkensis]|uniref:SpaA isopeptide-forming pilin-related protein n=1 Tax=Listeria newyorkensis TaxID=1497681 RepID=UPI000740EA39